MDLRPLLNLIEKAESICILTHENADADAVGSSLAMKIVLDELGKETLVFSPKSVSRIGKLLAENQGHQITTSPPSTSFDLILCIDARPTDDHVVGRKLAVIDHHEGPPVAAADFNFIDPTFPSTSEMVFEFLEYLISKDVLKTIQRDVAIQLLSGIIADTGNLRFSVRTTLNRVVRISTLSGVEVRDVFSLMRTPQDPSLRMACLKGASRLKIRKEDGYVIVITQVSSFHGDVASSLIHLGADVAFAGGKKKQILNVSSRARNEIVLKGLSLAEIMQEVASKIGGEGGGHAAAAALRGQGDVDKTLRICVNETRRAIAVMNQAKQAETPSG